MNADAQERYARHLVMPEVGREGQTRLMRSHVLVVGAGGLGAPVLQYLAAAGVGQITIMDPDRVERSNLQRQVLFGEAHVGRPKAGVAAEVLAAQNPLVKVSARETRFVAGDAVDTFDLVVDCTDNFAARYALLAATHGRLDHHQGMIGDHYVGRPGPSDGPFDEALAIVIAG